MKKVICFVLCFCFFPCVSFSEEEGVALDEMTPSLDPVRLQHGARTFINYCLNCHSASGFRYAALQKIGLTKEEILSELAPGHKMSDFLMSSLSPKDAEKWFGVAPPDLSWEARARSVDWLYTYLKSFYRDNARPMGWNNTLFPNVNMPNVFYDLEGVRGVSFEELRALHDDSGHFLKYVYRLRRYAGDGAHTETIKDFKDPDHFPYERILWEEPQKGLMSPMQYDQVLTDLVSFMAYMAQPHLKEREIIGFFFLTWLVILSVLFYFLKASFWKDIE